MTASRPMRSAEHLTALASRHGHLEPHQRRHPGRHHGHRHGDHRRRPGRPVDGLLPAEAWHPLRHHRCEHPRRRQLAPAVGQPQALLARARGRATRTSVPRAPLDLPGQGLRRRLPRDLRTHLQPAGAPRDTSAGAGRRGGRLLRHDGSGTVHLPQRRRRHGHLRSYAERARRRGRARPRHPPAALERVPPTRPDQRRPGARGGRQPLRLRHRLRAGRDPPDDPRRPRLRRDPSAAGVAGVPCGLPGCCSSRGSTSSPAAAPCATS